MADNFESFRRFSAFPPNIARYGSTVEELALQKGQPDPDPGISPMPATALTVPRLALLRAGSDRLRLTEPKEPPVNPFEGPKPVLVLSRSAAAKLSGSVIGRVSELVEAGVVRDDRLTHRMRDSLRRVALLRDYLERVNALTETIYVRAIAASKG